MQNILKNATVGYGSSTPWILLLILVGYILGALFLFTLIGQFLVAILFDYELNDIVNLISNPLDSDEAKMPLMVLQGVTSVGTFILVPLFFLVRNLKLPIATFTQLPGDPVKPIFMTVVILFCFMVANSLVIEWNQNLIFPEFLSEFENWAHNKEVQFEQLTRYLTTFSGIWEYFLGLLIIAVIPAIGEELLFRGLIQNLFGSIFKNPHTAIWLSAIIFGVFHLQFYGVIPRIFLGALFGYIYYWSGHLSLAMVAHFINNAFTLTLLYLTQTKVIDYDPISSDASPPLYVIVIFFGAGTLLLYLFRNYFKRNTDG